MFVLYRWIKQAEGRNLKIASAEDLSYMRTVERCLRMGDPLLLIVSLFLLLTISTSFYFFAILLIQHQPMWISLCPFL